MGDVAGRHPAADEVCHRLGFAGGGGRGVDHGAEGGMAHGLDQPHGLRDRLDEDIVGRGQRLDAIGEAARGDLLRQAGKEVAGPAEGDIGPLPGRRAALGGRAMDENARAETRSQIEKAEDDVAGPAAQPHVGRHDGEAGRGHQQPVEPGDGEAVILDRPPRFGDGGRGEPVRLLAQREGRDLQAVIADGPGEGALPGEVPGREHLVAEGEAHRCRSWLGRAADPRPTGRGSRRRG